MNMRLRKLRVDPPPTIQTQAPPPLPVARHGSEPVPIELPRFVRWLRRRSRLRRIAEAVVTGRQLAPGETVTVGRTLLSKCANRWQQKTAVWICATGTIDAADAAELGQQLSGSIKKQRRWVVPRTVGRAWSRATNFAALVAIVVQLTTKTLLAPGVLVGDRNVVTLVHMFGAVPKSLSAWPPWLVWLGLTLTVWLFDFLAAAVLVPLIYPLWPLWYGISHTVDFRLRIRTRNQITALSHLRLPATAPQLAAMAAIRSYRGAAIPGLARVVPLLGDEYYGRLTGSEVGMMCKVLYYTQGAERTALLRAIQAVGDSSALDALRVYVRHKDVVNSPELLRQCYETIETIGARMERQTAPGMLLRPADIAGSGMLLRASDRLTDDQGSLLQASTGPE
ncbi:MAG: hypothetical protein KGJ62_00260 [Armatimonadetes bacterium]|nr:hypothetical protein [Armatimonadota bacterium]MDE2206056.1 hypothetical protein [Armatimonadota bacterium]